LQRREIFHSPLRFQIEKEIKNSNKLRFLILKIIDIFANMITLIRNRHLEKPHY